MKEWIKNNHTWFFSGLGVFILTLLFGGISWAYKNTEVFTHLFWTENITFNRLQNGLSIFSSIIATLIIVYLWIQTKLKKMKNEITNLISKDTFLDDLVEIPNIKALEHKFLEGLNLAKDKKTPLSLMLIDIDNFKRFNDEFNYDTGNFILQQFIKLIKTNIRNKDDSIIRYQNGDEFIVIASKTTGRNGEKFGERLKDLVEKENFKILNTSKIDSITISVGVTEVDLDTDKLKEVELRLEEGLKLAKQKGKNRIELIRK